MSLENTKERILKVANDLFASKGFNGTSIRDIANAADVNLSAVNYHFKNKEKLYWDVFDFNYDWLNEKIQQLSPKSETTAELAVNTFCLFVNEDVALKNIFKMIISDSFTPSEVNAEEELCDGPPGEEVFLEKLKNDIATDCPLEAQKWAVKMIFSLLVHFGVMVNTTAMKEKCKNDDSMSIENIEKSISHSVQAHLQYLKSNGANWK
jgi:AcrR family transcriptional regulator